MKVIKKIAPILLILTIVLCLLFCFLVILNVPISLWYFNKVFNDYFGLSNYYIINDSSLLFSGELPLLSYIVEAIPYNDFSPVLDTTFYIISSCLIPVTIIIISVIILAFFIALTKSKNSLFINGAIGKITKTISIIALFGTILASLFICIASLPNVILSIIDIFKGIKYFPYLAISTIDFLLSIVSISVFFLIFVSSIFFLIITIKSWKKRRLPTKKALVPLCTLSIIGTAISSFVTLHLVIAQVIYIISTIIEFPHKYILTIEQSIINLSFNLLLSLGLIALILSITVGFITTLIKVIISLKKTSKKELYAYNSDELALFDTPEESTDGDLPDDNTNKETETGNETDEIALTEIEIKEEI